ncbi:MAG: hypothetical protein FJ388_16200 [Verrucomicrobia bacterium]|nr:hypothetical protein [Verrucomicrobiota bacterium]
MDYDIYEGIENGLWRTLTLPTDGRTLYVTLWSLVNNSWQSNAYTYTAYNAGASPKAQMLSPVNGSTLDAATTTFIWDTGVGVTRYALWVGSNPNSFDLYAGWETGQWRTLVLPTDGRTLYVRLWSWVNGGWQCNDYQYTASGP